VSSNQQQSNINEMKKTFIFFTMPNSDVETFVIFEGMFCPEPYQKLIVQMDRESVEYILGSKLFSLNPNVNFLLTFEQATVFVQHPIFNDETGNISYTCRAHRVEYFNDTLIDFEKYNPQNMKRS
jgi:hypothetical protein